MIYTVDGKNIEVFAYIWNKVQSYFMIVIN